MPFRFDDGPLAFAPGTSPFHIKGEFWRNLALSVAHAEKKTGRLHALLARDGVLEMTTGTFLASDFYDILPLPRVTAALAEVLGRDLHAFTEKLGRDGAKLQMETVYQSFFKALTRANVAQRCGQILDYLYDFGKSSAVRHDHGVDLVRSGMPLNVAEWWCEVSIPYFALPVMDNDGVTITSTFAIEETGTQHGVPVGNAIWHFRW